MIPKYTGSASGLVIRDAGVSGATRGEDGLCNVLRNVSMEAEGPCCVVGNSSRRRQILHVTYLHVIVMQGTMMTKLRTLWAQGRGPGRWGAGPIIVEAQQVQR